MEPGSSSSIENGWVPVMIPTPHQTHAQQQNPVANNVVSPPKSSRVALDLNLPGLPPSIDPYPLIKLGIDPARFFPPIGYRSRPPFTDDDDTESPTAKRLKSDTGDEVDQKSEGANEGGSKNSNGDVENDGVVGSDGAVKKFAFDLNEPPTDDEE